MRHVCPCSNARGMRSTVKILRITVSVNLSTMTFSRQRGSRCLAKKKKELSPFPSVSSERDIADYPARRNRLTLQSPGLFPVGKFRRTKRMTRSSRGFRGSTRSIYICGNSCTCATIKSIQYTMTVRRRSVNEGNKFRHREK